MKRNDPSGWRWHPGDPVSHYPATDRVLTGQIVAADIATVDEAASRILRPGLWAARDRERPKTAYDRMFEESVRDPQWASYRRARAGIERTGRVLKVLDKARVVLHVSRPR